MLSLELFISNFYMSPCSSDYIIPFGSGARGAIILSSGSSRCTFHSPFRCYGLAQDCLISEMSPEFTRFSSRAFIKQRAGPYRSIAARGLNASHPSVGLGTILVVTSGAGNGSFCSVWTFLIVSKTPHRFLSQLSYVQQQLLQRFQTSQETYVFHLY